MCPPSPAETHTLGQHNQLIYCTLFSFILVYTNVLHISVIYLAASGIFLEGLCLFPRCHLGRIAVFSVTVFYDERIVIVAEQRPDASEEDSFQWMSRVLQVKSFSMSVS